MPARRAVTALSVRDRAASKARRADGPGAARYFRAAARSSWTAVVKSATGFTRAELICRNCSVDETCDAVVTAACPHRAIRERTGTVSRVTTFARIDLGRHRSGSGKRAGMTGISLAVQEC